MRYDPRAYDVENLAQAKRVILTPVAGITSEERWERETPYLVEEIGNFLSPTEDTVILDYGCGIGRLSKGLISRYRCSVMGVDISASMRRLAVEYVNSPRFSVCSLDFMTKRIASGFSAHHAIAVWVLQHCPFVERDIQTIERTLKPGGVFYVLNDVKRSVPTSTGWVNDGKDVRALLLREFIELHSSHLRVPESMGGFRIGRNTFICKLKKKERSIAP